MESCLSLVIFRAFIAIMRRGDTTKCECFYLREYSIEGYICWIIGMNLALHDFDMGNVGYKQNMEGIIR